MSEPEYLQSELIDFEFRDDAAMAAVEGRLDPVSIVAQAMVRLVVDGKPETAATAKVKGAVVVLVTPGEWSSAVEDAWRLVVLGQSEAGVENNYRNRHLRSAEEREWPFGCNADPGRKAWSVREELGIALRTGQGVLAVTDDACKASATILAAADIVVTTPPPTPGILRAVSEIVGSGDGIQIDASLADVIKPDHLAACLRPGQTAFAYLARLSRVAAQAAPLPQAAVGSPRWTLDRLHGNGEAQSFGNALAKDMRAFIAGELDWSEVSPGVMLSGPPGCGKTITAQAFAHACGVPLIATSYSEWQGAGKEGHLGELTKCLRGKFAEARKNAPCILFIDEIDSVRSRRSSGGGGAGVRHDDWWTAITNALLEELDGCQGHAGVVVIAASNYPEKVDPALRRSGRLDREIRLSAPDGPAISAILREHLGDTLADVDLSHVSDAALGGSGADIATWVRTARQAARHAGRPMAVGDMTAAIHPLVAPLPPAVRRRTAYHEAGHVVCVAIYRPGSIQRVSIRAGSAGKGSLGGVIMDMAHEETTASDVAVILRGMMAGRAAEEIVFGECGCGSGGPEESDLAQATMIAASLELSLGMGESLTWSGDPTFETLPHMLFMHRDVALRVEQRLAGALADARSTLERHRPALDALAEALIERGALSGTAAEEIVFRTLAT